MSTTDNQLTITSVALSKPLRPATRKEKAFAKYLVDNPSATITEAYQATYNWNGGLEGAYQEGSRTLKKPQVKLELAKYAQEAESVLVEVLEYSNRIGKEGGHVGVGYTGHAITVAKDILDRTHGKATQKIESHSTTVTLSLNIDNIVSDTTPPTEVIDQPPDQTKK